MEVLVRIVQHDKSNAYAIIPAWKPGHVIKIPLTLIPDNLKNIKRLFADINIDVEKEEDLIFKKFTMAKHPSGDYQKLLKGEK